MMTPEGPAKECGELTSAAWRTAWEKLTEWTDIVEGSPIKTGVKFSYRRYWKSRNKRAGIPVTRRLHREISK